MVLPVDTIDDALDGIEAIVVDQWGVLHDGSTPYPFAVRTLSRLKLRKYRLAILSNSGKRATPNEVQVTRLGFPPGIFDCVMTSGEALWQSFAAGEMPYARLHAVARAPGDAETWSAGLGVDLVPLEAAEAVLLMGLPEESAEGDRDDLRENVLRLRLPVLCSNPDIAAPRANGKTVPSPGSIAHDLAASGADVRYIGKPHLPVFRAVEAALNLPPEKCLMVGDSLEHDIAGARNAGWRSAFIRGGLHAGAFRSGEVLERLAELVDSTGTPLPDFTLDFLR